MRKKKMEDFLRVLELCVVSVSLSLSPSFLHGCFHGSGLPIVAEVSSDLLLFFDFELFVRRVDKRDDCFLR